MNKEHRDKNDMKFILEYLKAYFKDYKTFFINYDEELLLKVSNSLTLQKLGKDLSLVKFNADNRVWELGD